MNWNDKIIVHPRELRRRNMPMDGSEFKQCNVCKEMHWSDVECLPEYEVHCEKYFGENFKIIRACDHKESAEKFAKWLNEETKGKIENVAVEVKVIRENIVKYFNVTAEKKIIYSSIEIKKEG